MKNKHNLVLHSLVTINIKFVDMELTTVTVDILGKSIIIIFIVE